MPRAADPTEDQPITRTILFDARLRQVKDTDRAEIREIRILPGYAAGCACTTDRSPAASSPAR